MTMEISGGYDCRLEDTGLSGLPTSPDRDPGNLSGYGERPACPCLHLQHALRSLT